MNELRYLCLFDGEETREGKLARSLDEALCHLFQDNNPSRVYMLDFGNNTVTDISAEIAIKWFDCWIKGGADPKSDRWPDFVWRHLPVGIYEEYLAECGWWATADSA